MNRLLTASLLAGAALMLAQAPASAFYMGEARIDNCRIGTDYVRCGSGQNTSNPPRPQTNARVPGLSYFPKPPHCGGGYGEVVQGSINLGGGKIGQGNVGGNVNSVGGPGK